MGGASGNTVKVTDWSAWRRGRQHRLVVESSIQDWWNNYRKCREEPQQSSLMIGCRRPITSSFPECPAYWWNANSPEGVDPHGCRVFCAQRNNNTNPLSLYCHQYCHLVKHTSAFQHSHTLYRERSTPNVKLRTNRAILHQKFKVCVCVCVYVYLFLYSQPTYQRLCACAVFPHTHKLI